jgi:hypothetical protein
MSTERLRTLSVVTFIAWRSMRHMRELEIALDSRGAQRSIA